MNGKNLVCLKEVDIAAAFAAFGFRSDHGRSYAGWLCDLYDDYKLDLPRPHRGDMPANKGLLDYIKDELNKRGIAFGWSPHKRRVSFVGYPVTDAKRQPSLLEIAVLLKRRPDIFVPIDAAVPHRLAVNS